MCAADVEDDSVDVGIIVAIIVLVLASGVACYVFVSRKHRADNETYAIGKNREGTGEDP